MSQIAVRVADLAVGRAGDVLVTVGIGSCVAIILHDPVAQVGGLAHVLLPSRTPTRALPARGKVPETAVPALLEEMTMLGAVRERTTARLVGGASMFAVLAPPGALQMGERNLIASRQALAAARLPLVGEECGGEHGRSVRFDIGTGAVLVTTAKHGQRTL